LGKAIVQAREHGFLGENILGTEFSFDIEVRLGAGSYLCGEETALLESLEGKRGWPRIRPPYPATCGLWGRCTALNNVETLANIPEIVVRGADWFRGMGVASSPGTKLFCLSGHIERPGVVETEMGVPLRTLIYEFGGGVQRGRRLKAVLVGGAAGAFVTPDALDVPMDFDSLRERGAALGSGAILVMDESTCIVDILSSILRFFRHESCGKCAPCRAGTDVLVRLIEGIQAGERDERTLDLMEEIAGTMEAASLCPLGQSVVLPVRTAIAHFRNDILAPPKEAVA
jgi:NADH:ubiquinone oxidoreductase subunit F (NADH-binding)